MQNHEQNFVLKKAKIQNSIVKTNFYFGIQPLGNFGHMATCRSSSRNTRKMNLQSILNKKSRWDHMELGFDVLAIAKKLVKNEIYLFKNKN
jgi:hypothetical protein